MGVLIKLMTKSGDPRKDGTKLIYVLVRIRNVDRLFSTERYILPQHFDNVKGEVKKTADGAMKINYVLSDLKKKYTDSILEIELEGKVVTHEELCKKLNKNSDADFIEFCETELEHEKGLISQKHYSEMKMHIRALKSWCKTANIHNMDLVFLENYQKYLTAKGNKINTIAVYFRTFRRFFNIALKKGITTNYPFRFYKFKTEETHKEYLTIEEIVKLYDLYFTAKLGDRLQGTLYYFLIGCFTGLRLQDCRKIEQIAMEGNMLVWKTQKTSKIVRIPISTRTKKLLENPYKKPLKLKKQQISIDIKEFLQLIGVEKHISFHCSRHSFAINSLVLGIPIEVVSDILGHTSLKTTQIYAKIVNEHKQREMKKWDF